jgi:TonB-linked SusC/RagA family outer membrane protein
MKEDLKILLKGSPGKKSIRRFLFKLFLVIITALIVSTPASVFAQAPQKFTVTGTVVDGVTGEAMPGVNVVIAGTTTGAMTDMNGKFTIVAPSEEANLSISFIGYTPQVIKIGKQRQLRIALAIESKTLEDVIVVGYGVQKKESVVGAVTQATGELVKSTSQGADLGNALTGALPGLVTISTTGVPGGSDQDNDYALMYIRGQKTWNNAMPLVIVDGVERPLQNVNPYEIEKISVLKDASATAVFGVKGANGVIMITTQRGREGKPVFNVDMTMTAKTVSRLPSVEDSYTGNLVKNYAIMNEVPVMETSWPWVVPNRWLDLYKSQKYPYYLPNVDWKKEFLNKYGYDRNVNLNISGGTKYVKYFGSLGYTYEGDVFKIQDYGQGYSPNFSFNRYNYRSNLDFDITSTTRFTVNLSGYFSNQARPAGDEYRGFSNLYSQPPDLWPARYSDGTWGDFEGYNRFANGILAFNFGGQDFTKRTNINTDFIFDQKLDFITKGLSVGAKLSYDNTSVSLGPNIDGYGKIAKYIDPSIVDDPDLHDGMTADEIYALENKTDANGKLRYTTWKFPSSISQFQNTGYNWTDLPNSYSSESGDNTRTYRNIYYQFSINYARDFGKHSVSGLGLMSRQIQATGSEFPSYREDWVGRVTYSYDRRYMAEFNGAYNGSEKFAPKYRFGFFPSMAFGWVVSNEPFFEPLKKYVSTIKFRYSDGKVGSDEITGDANRWLYVGDWNVRSGSATEDVYRFGYPNLQSSYPLRYEGVIPNPAIHWETAHKQDFGIETGFFKDQVKVNFDYFTEHRTEIFMVGTDIVVPAYFGASPVSANLGAVNMSGWEFELNLTLKTSWGLSYWINHSWTFAKDQILARGDPELKPAYQKQAGYQIGQPRETVNVSEHPMQTWNEIYNNTIGSDNTNLLPGDYAIVDYNSDGIIDSNDDIPYGYPQRPQYTYAPSAGASYKNLSANVRFYGVYNVEGEAGTYNGTFGYQFTTLWPRDMERGWSPELGNTLTATQPAIRFTTSGRSGYIPTSRAYLKLQHAEIGYDFRSQYLKRMGVSKFRIILSGDNLALWSDMTEDLDSDRPTTQTNTRRTYPKMKRYNLGLSLGF